MIDKRLDGCSNNASVRHFFSQFVYVLVLLLLPVLALFLIELSSLCEMSQCVRTVTRTCLLQSHACNMQYVHYRDLESLVHNVMPK